MTHLIEFKNKKGEILRGLVDKADSQKGVIFIHGFERTTIESKFKNIVDKLRGKVNLFRFDFSGCGLSDGKFEDLTVEKLKEEMEAALATFKKEVPRLKPINLVAHSLGSCIALKFLSENPEKISKIVFLSPAFNQKELHRYWFTKSLMEKEGILIDWNNFKNYHNEDKFKEYVNIKKRMTKTHEILNDYFLECEKTDFQDSFRDSNSDFKNILIIHGVKDDKVPLESNDKLPKEIKIIKVLKGDHDIERMDMAGEYLDAVIEFLK